MKYISKERLSLEHSIIMNNAPVGVLEGRIELPKHLEQFSEISPEQFGLFDTSSPNFNNYYPDVESKDLVPMEGDFIYPIFRALSKVIVRPSAPIDFGKGTVLKDSMNLLVGMAVYPNHEMITGDELGVVKSVEWSDSKEVKTSTGGKLKVPAGMNATLMIDGKSNPRIARSINMNPPSIHSVSVTVEFEWEQSHPKMERDEFFSKLGQFDEQGNLVKRIATKIIRYHEISLVPHGADPFAQKVGGDGNIVNPHYASATYKFSEMPTGELFAESDSTSGSYITYKDRTSFSEDSEGTSILESNIINNNKTSTEMKKFIDKLKEKFPELTEDQLEEKALGLLADANSDNSEEMDQLKEQVTSLTTEKGELAGKLTLAETERDSYKVIADKALAEVKAEVTRLANLVNENSTEQSLLDLIQGASYDVATSLLTQYKKLAKDKLGDGSIEEEDEQEEQETTGTGSLEEALDLLVKEKTPNRASKLH